jgi:hypothetical protein
LEATADVLPWQAQSAIAAQAAALGSTKNLIILSMVQSCKNAYHSEKERFTGFVKRVGRV